MTEKPAASAALSAAVPIAVTEARGAGRAPALQAKVDAYLKPFVAARDFSGIVLMTRGTETVADGVYGLASQEFGVPNDRTMRFNIASISKMFTVAALLELERLGKLALTDPLARYIPGTTLVDPPDEP